MQDSPSWLLFLKVEASVSGMLLQSWCLCGSYVFASLSSFGCISLPLSIIPGLVYPKKYL